MRKIIKHLRNVYEVHQRIIKQIAKTDQGTSKNIRNGPPEQASLTGAMLGVIFDQTPMKQSHELI